MNIMNNKYFFALRSIWLVKYLDKTQYFNSNQTTYLFGKWKADREIVKSRQFLHFWISISVNEFILAFWKAYLIHQAS